MSPNQKWIALSVLMAITGSACGDTAAAREARDEIGEAIDATRDLVVETWADLQRKAEPRLRQATADLDALRQQLARQGEQAGAKAGEVVAEAEQRLEKARARLAEAKDAGADAAKAAWQDIDRGLQQASDSIASALERIKGG